MSIWCGVEDDLRSTSVILDGKISSPRFRILICNMQMSVSALPLLRPVKCKHKNVHTDDSIMENTDKCKILQISTSPSRTVRLTPRTPAPVLSD